MKTLTTLLQAQFDKMCNTNQLFRSSVSGHDLWTMYLANFEEGDDPIFRDPASSSHNCNYCKNFIRRYGNIVAIDVDGKLMSMFDVEVEKEYTASFKTMSKALQTNPIQDVFIETLNELRPLGYESKLSKTQTTYKLGLGYNIKRYTAEEAAKFGVVRANETKTFHHFSLEIPARFIYTGSSSIESLTAAVRDRYSVFKRAIQELPVDTLALVSDLINQGSLLDGDAHLHSVRQMIELKKEAHNLFVKTELRDSWYWSKAYLMDDRTAKFKNTLIGVLCTELAEGLELNKACQNWNKRVDPVNYMKAVAPVTQRQIEEAQKFVEENGYVESFDRRFATIDDIKVSEILHSNMGDGELKSVSIFDKVKSSPSTRHKRAEFDKLEEVSIEKFMTDILPGCTSVEAFLDAKAEGNMVTLTTANVEESKPIFKWSNNYSWTYKGNIAGKSQIKEEVKSKGGKVDGVLRFSMMWADGDGDNSDLDLHCIEPNGGMHIYFGYKRSDKTGGNLDIDITQPNGKLSVENITYPTLAKMLDGKYQLFIRQYSDRGSKGFSAEIEFNGEVYSYSYPKAVRGDVQIAEVTLRKGEFTIEHKLTPTESSGVIKEIYGLNSGQLHKVNLVCLSPNHWNGQGVGNKHYFFMLDGCKTSDPVRSFHNENLIQDLLDHRKVMEVLGTTNMLEPTDTQLSGLGFNATVRDELVVKLSGTHKRMLKIKF
jgi:hypothetical protein